MAGKEYGSGNRQAPTHKWDEDGNEAYWDSRAHQYVDKRGTLITPAHWFPSFCRCGCAVPDRTRLCEVDWAMKAITYYENEWKRMAHSWGELRPTKPLPQSVKLTKWAACADDNSFAPSKYAIPRAVALTLPVRHTLYAVPGPGKEWALYRQEITFTGRQTNAEKTGTWTQIGTFDSIAEIAEAFATIIGTENLASV